MIAGGLENIKMLESVRALDKKEPQIDNVKKVSCDSINSQSNETLTDIAACKTAIDSTESRYELDGYRPVGTVYYDIALACGAYEMSVMTGLKPASCVKYFLGNPATFVDNAPIPSGAPGRNAVAHLTQSKQELSDNSIVTAEQAFGVARTKAAAFRLAQAGGAGNAGGVNPAGAVGSPSTSASGAAKDIFNDDGSRKNRLYFAPKGDGPKGNTTVTGEVEGLIGGKEEGEESKKEVGGSIALTLEHHIKTTPNFSQNFNGALELLTLPDITTASMESPLRYSGSLRPRSTETTLTAYFRTLMALGDGYIEKFEEKLPKVNVIEANPTTKWVEDMFAGLGTKGQTIYLQSVLRPYLANVATGKLSEAWKAAVTDGAVEFKNILALDKIPDADQAAANSVGALFNYDTVGYIETVALWAGRNPAEIYNAVNAKLTGTGGLAQNQFGTPEKNLAVLKAVVDVVKELKLQNAFKDATPNAAKFVAPAMPSDASMMVDQKETLDKLKEVYAKVLGKKPEESVFDLKSYPSNNVWAVQKRLNEYDFEKRENFASPARWYFVADAGIQDYWGAATGLGVAPGLRLNLIDTKDGKKSVNGNLELKGYVGCSRTELAQIDTSAGPTLCADKLSVGILLSAERTFYESNEGFLRNVKGKGLLSRAFSPSDQEEPPPMLSIASPQLGFEVVAGLKWSGTLKYMSIWVDPKDEAAPDAKSDRVTVGLKVAKNDTQLLEEEKARKKQTGDSGFGKRKFLERTSLGVSSEWQYGHKGGARMEVCSKEDTLNDDRICTIIGGAQRQLRFTLEYKLDEDRAVTGGLLVNDVSNIQGGTGDKDTFFFAAVNF